MGGVPDVDVIHATAIAIDGRAVLIRGKSGSGKSDLALRCLLMAPSALVPSQAELVSDDRVEVFPREQKLHVRPPPSIAGLMEVRGAGVFRVPYRDEAIVTLVADLVSTASIARFPDPPASTELLGVILPQINIAPFEASAPAKLLLALSRK